MHGNYGNHKNKEAEVIRLRCVKNQLQRVDREQVQNGQTVLDRVILTMEQQ